MVDKTEEQEMKYIGFYLEENYKFYLKELSRNHRCSFNKMSQIIRHCIKKQLPKLLEEAKIEYKED